MTVEYTICKGENQADLKKAVNQEIKNGWQPLGGVAVTSQCVQPRGQSDQGPVFFQAMIKTTQM